MFLSFAHLAYRDDAKDLLDVEASLCVNQVWFDFEEGIDES